MALNFDDAMDVLRWHDSLPNPMRLILSSRAHELLGQKPKETKMNELMLALETMIRRIVQEEMISVQNREPAVPFPADTMAAMQRAGADHSIAFRELLMDNIRDTAWFDEAIKSEVAVTLDNAPPPPPVEPLTLFENYYFVAKLDERINQASADAIRDSTWLRTMMDRTFENGITNALDHSSFRDRIKEIFDDRLDASDLPSLSDIDNAVDKAAASEMSDIEDALDDRIKTVLRDTSFSITVDR